MSGAEMLTISHVARYPMKKMLALSFLLLTTYLPAQELILPEKIEAKVNRLTAVKIDSTFKSVEWIVTPIGSDIDIFREYDPDLKTIRLRFIAYKEGTYNLTVAASNGKLVLKTCTITVGQPSPTPVPPPVPVPVGKKVKSLTFVVLAHTPKTIIVTEDADLRKWIESKGIGIYGITTQEQLNNVPRFAGITTPPCVVLQDEDNNVITSLQLVNAESIKNTVLHYLGK